MRLHAALTRLPLVGALGFVGVFVLLPLAVLAWQTIDGPDGLTLDAWRAFVREKYRTEPVVTYLETPIVVDNVTDEVVVDA